MNKHALGEKDTAVGSLFFVILDAAFELQARMEVDLEKVGLSGAKASVLDVLGKATEALTLSDVADRNCCVRSNITQLIDRLEVDGLVRRVNDPDDRRIRRAALTTAGRKAWEDAKVVIAKQEQGLAEILSREEVTVLTRALSRISS
ncbi:MAG: MarR family winged helix-turn-helix transcriptional regulator [Gemmatimonadales bacterium]